MHHHLYFHQDCPTCRRGLRLPIEWYGSEIRCVGCRGAAAASEVGEARSGTSRSGPEASRRSQPHEPETSI